MKLGLTGESVLKGDVRSEEWYAATCRYLLVRFFSDGNVETSCGGDTGLTAFQLAP